MSVLIVGAKGMLGHALTEVFSEKHDVVSFGQEELDITDPQAIHRHFAEVRPDVVINAAAYTDVDGAEENGTLANLVNGDAVGYLAKACVDFSAAFIHYSTDYVFSGNNPAGYSEDDEPDEPVNAYGRSKLIGEEQLLSFEPETLRWFLVRTSWLYGPKGKNFVDTMLKLGKEREELKVVDDQHGKPTYTFDLAYATQELLSSEEDHESGIYHITNETPGEGITWFDFAVEIFRQAVLPTRVVPVSSIEFPRPAKRPQYSMLKNTKMFLRRSWDDALADYLQRHALV